MKILNAGVYGQVAQRRYGFLKARCQYVLQLDDDMLVDRDCIEKLIYQVKKCDSRCCVSPYLMSNTNRRALHESERYNLLSSVYYYILNGKEKFKSGSVSLSGISFGVNKEDLEVKAGVLAVEWQPGGCILHKRENLILNDYYPFPGKGYSEDLIHSYLLKNKNVSLLLDLDAICYTDIISDNLSFRELYYEFRARRYYVKMSSLSILRLHIFYGLYILKKIISRSVRK